MRKNIWNAKAVKYSGELTYEDFILDRKNASIVHFSEPINEGAEPGWRYKNLVTKDIGSEKIYLAWIHLDPKGGHDYHAHLGDEIIYVLENRVQFFYRSKNDENVKSILEKNSAAFIPAGTPHSVWNIDEEPCTFIVIKSPPYFLEEIPLDPTLRQIKLYKGR